jgi:hypothetical protein
MKLMNEAWSVACGHFFGISSPPAFWNDLALQRHWASKFRVSLDTYQTQKETRGDAATTTDVWRAREFCVPVTEHPDCAIPDTIVFIPLFSICQL